jgi:hypothetical protein
MQFRCWAANPPEPVTTSPTRRYLPDTLVRR